MYNPKAIEFYEKGRQAEQEGRYSSAEKMYKKAIHFDSKFPGSFNNLGNLYMDKGLLAKAETAYRKALAFAPDNPMVLNNIGNVLRTKGDHAKAIGFFDEALAQEEDYFEALSNRGISLRELGKGDEAIAAYRKALEINPDSYEVNINLGNVLIELGQYQESATCYRNAIALNPDSHLAYNGLGNACANLGKSDEAKDCYLKAIGMFPGYEESYTNLANLLHELGLPGEAEDYLQKAIELNPEHAESYRLLSQLRKFEAQDSGFLNKIESMRARKKVSEENLIHFDFALAKACEDIGDYEKSFGFLEEGNRLRKKQLSYSVETEVELFDRIKSASSNLPRLAQAVDDEPSDSDFVFILGMPRSGTTLTEQILSSHSRVTAGGELELMSSALGSYFSADRESPGGLEAEDIASIRRKYVDGIRELNLKGDLITDKMPINFKWTGFILAAFPNAKIIHLSRNPIAVCWSNFKAYFKSGGNGFIYDLEDLVAFYDLYLDLMGHWNDLFPDRIFTLNYEKLTENQESETRRLLEYCGLEFEQACLDFHQSDRAVQTASAMQVRQKIYQGSSEAWKRFESFVPQLTERFGSEQD